MSFISSMQSMNIEVTSPQGTVSATYSPQNGLQLAQGPDGISLQDEESLAQEIEEVIKGATILYQKQASAILDEASQEKNNRNRPRATTGRDAWEEKERTRIYINRLTELEVQNEEDGITVSFYGDGDIVVTFDVHRFNSALESPTKFFESLTQLVDTTLAQLSSSKISLQNEIRSIKL